MAKSIDTPITQGDIQAYLASTSDFDFEMAVLEKLTQARYECDHAGTYRDPVTDKIRAYDFRARRAITEAHHIRLAVECKNLRASSPLLVYATPRTEVESYHTLLLRGQSGISTYGAEPHLVEGIRSVYPPDEPVGRDTDQVAKNQAGGFISADAPTFEKLLQALHSTYDLVREAVHSSKYRSGGELVAVLPVVVVPDSLLWQVEYMPSGKGTRPARQVSNTTLICRHKWIVERVLGPVAIYISHIEVVTSSGLIPRLDWLTGRDGLFAHGPDVGIRP